MLLHAYVAGTHVYRALKEEDVGGRNEPGHDA
jgi:hypothetical protein